MTDDAEWQLSRLGWAELYHSTINIFPQAAPRSSHTPLLSSPLSVRQCDWFLPCLGSNIIQTGPWRPTHCTGQWTPVDTDHRPAMLWYHTCHCHYPHYCLTCHLLLRLLTASLPSLPSSTAKPGLTWRCHNFPPPLAWPPPLANRMLVEESLNHKTISIKKIKGKQLKD